jgi:uncharacterized DUF497 family protein
MDVEYWHSGICFRWDRRKAATNLRDHGVAFETACEAFFDPFVRWIGVEVVDDEERERMIGMTTDWRLLLVVYLEQKDAFRLISARPATRGERRAYEDY